MAAPTVTHAPTEMFGQANVAGVLTSVIAESHWLGEDIDRVFTLDRHQLLVALWYEAVHGDYRHRWWAWAQGIHPYLAGWRAMDVRYLTLPPTRPAVPEVGERDAWTPAA